MEERVLYLNEGVCLLLFRKLIFERYDCAFQIM